MGNDKIALVKIALLKSMPIVKPFVMSQLDRHHEMTETLAKLTDDMDSDV